VTRLLVIGVSHRTAPLSVRESLAVSGDALSARLAAMLPLCSEAMVVSTCNRHEWYVALPEGAPSGPLEDALCAGHPQVRGHLYRHEGDAAVRHLFRVAASLDSMVLGEPQILGQVKEAYAAAGGAGAVGPLLQRAVTRSFAVAKRVRSETRIGENSASVASVAVDLASHIFGGLAGHPVLVIGAGKMAELAARHLQRAQAASIWVVNRTRKRADELAARLHGVAYDYGEMEALLSRADVVLSSTGAQEPVVRHDLVARVMRARRGRWLLLLDIAVPRDIEARVGELENVYLYDMDALQEVVADNLAERRREAEAAEAIVRDEVRRFLQGERTQGVAPTIKALREQAQRVAQEEVARLLPRLQGATERDRQLVASMAEALVNKLLHGPLTALKKDAAADGQRPLRDLEESTRVLFGLDEGPRQARQKEPVTESAGEAGQAGGSGT
jgi:glutamyl-tRNA reductase